MSRIRNFTSGSSTKYIFILGNNPGLSKAEVKAVLPDAKVVEETAMFLILENKELDCLRIIDQLGGTIKVGEVVGKEINVDLVVKTIVDKKPDSKVKFGFSFYHGKTDKKLGMEVKSRLKKQGISSRLVVSKDKILSSVVVAKNKCLDFLVLPGYVGLTVAVQDFEKYGELDYGRPASDARSGMIPPKLAKMMINLAQVDKKVIVLDPFCGSGTILTEAAAMGYKNLTGCDSSTRAVDDTKKNMGWVEDRFQVSGFKFQAFKLDVKKLVSRVNPESVDAIVTEPDLGPALRGTPNEKEVLKIRGELEGLYVDAFEQFKKVLKSGGRVVMVWPQWRLGGRSIDMTIGDKVKQLGFKQLDRNDLIYGRPDQKVWRKITIWEK